MVASMNREELAYDAVRMGLLEIRDDGSVWKIAIRRGSRWGTTPTIRPCDPRRAENPTGAGYLQVRVMLDRVRHHALAHRLVYLHFRGPIPAGLTINHINGVKDDNRPENLETATYSEQLIHARSVLGKMCQKGSKNNASRLTDADIRKIRALRETGLTQAKIGEIVGCAHQTVSKILRGDRWGHLG